MSIKKQKLLSVIVVLLSFVTFAFGLNGLIFSANNSNAATNTFYLKIQFNSVDGKPKYAEITAQTTDSYAKLTPTNVESLISGNSGAYINNGRCFWTENQDDVSILEDLLTGEDTYTPGIPIKKIVAGTNATQDGVAVTFKTGWGSISYATLQLGDMEIYNETDLKQFRDAVNASFDFSRATITLKEDVDLENKDWTPIGFKSDNPFSGTFDGNGHKIKNLTIIDDYNEFYDSGIGSGNVGAGLFASIKGYSTIKNLWLDGVDIRLYRDKIVETSCWCTTDAVGCLTGNIVGGWVDIVNCKVTNGKIKTIGDAFFGTVGESANAGGLVGAVAETSTAYVKDCDVECDIEVRKDLWGEFVCAGGIVGMLIDTDSKAIIYNCFYKGVMVVRNEKNGDDDNPHAACSACGGIVGSTLTPEALNKIVIENCLTWLKEGSSCVKATDDKRYSFHPIWAGDARGSENGFVFKDSDKYSLSNNKYIKESSVTFSSDYDYAFSSDWVEKVKLSDIK